MVFHSLLARHAAALARARAALDEVAAIAQELRTALEQRDIGPVSVAAAHVPAVVPILSTGEPLVPPATHAASSPLTVLCDRLESLAKTLAESGPQVDPAESAFLTKARPVLVAAGPALAQRAGDVLAFCDKLGGFYLGTAYARLHASLAEIRCDLIPLLAPFRLVDPVETPPAQPMRLPVARAVVVTTGLVDAGGTVVRAGQAVLPDPAPSPERIAAWGLLEELYAALAAQWRKPLRDDLARGVELCLLSTALDLRTMLNLHTRQAERADTPAAKLVLDRLRDVGLRPLLIPTGERFDPERHDPKRFDRVERPSTGVPAGTVIGLRQLGLADQTGLPIQKCIVITAA